MNEERQINLTEAIRHTFAEATRLAKEATGYASEAVSKALECGRLLLEQKAALGHGSWLGWLDTHLPEISDSTARRYMRLAKAAPTLTDASDPGANQPLLTDLEKAPTLKHAYVTLGILPSPEGKPTRLPDPNKPWVRFTRFLDGFRLWFNRRVEEDPLESWPEDSRRVLKNELRWFADLHQRL